MKKLIFIVALACSALIFATCGGTSSPGSTTEQKQTKAVYTCEMHPEVMSDKPGNCPKCGMQLIKKEVPVTDTTQIHHSTDSTISK